MALRRVEIVLEPDDLARLKDDLLEHFRAFGVDVPPHLQAEANSNMDRILDNLTTCVQLKGTVDGEGDNIGYPKKGIVGS